MPKHRHRRPKSFAEYEHVKKELFPKQETILQDAALDAFLTFITNNGYDDFAHKLSEFVNGNGKGRQLTKADFNTMLKQKYAGDTTDIQCQRNTLIKYFDRAVVKQEKRSIP